MKSSVLFLLAALFAASAGAGEAAVGAVTHLSGTFSVQRADGSAKVLSVNSEVSEGDLLSTENETYARIKFVDNSEVVLRPNTQFKVEKFSFNEADASRDNAFFSLIKGGMRAVSGVIGKRSRDKVGYSTAVATIGIRGTNIGVLFCNSDCGGIPTASGISPANGLYVDVAAGQIIVSNPSGAQLFVAGQYGFVANLRSPPILVPPVQGIQVTMPPSIAQNAGQGRSPGGVERDTSCGF